MSKLSKQPLIARNSCNFQMQAHCFKAPSFVFQENICCFVLGAGDYTQSLTYGRKNSTTELYSQPLNPDFYVSKSNVSKSD